MSLIFIALFAGLGFGFVAGQEHGTIVPLYVWPEEKNGRHTWQSLIDAKKANPGVDVWAIVNANSGPGNSASPEYAGGMLRLLDNGIKMMGYVYTLYGNRDSAAVKSEIDKWVEFYPGLLSGIFFDEMAYEDPNKNAGYYRDVSQYAKSKGLTFTVGNPGTDTKPEFVGTVDNIVIFETNTGFPGEDRYGGWHTDYPRSTWSILPYNIQQLNEGQVRNAKGFVKYIYVTNDDLPNPWDTLPGYLSNLLSYLRP